MGVIADMIRAGIDPEIIERVHDELVEASRAQQPVKTARQERNARYFRQSISAELRVTVLERDGKRCVYCGSDGGGVQLHCDHVVPWSRGGYTSEANLVAACRPCNTSKKDKTPDEWMRR